MQLDRNLNGNGIGKYALLNVRRMTAKMSPEVQAAIDVLNQAGILEWGHVGEQDEFFVMKLKDVNTPSGLIGYAAKAEETDRELATDVRGMLPRAGANSPFCKRPD